MTDTTQNAKPVGWIQSDHLTKLMHPESDGQAHFCRMASYAIHPDFKPLYAAPIAQTADVREAELLALKMADRLCKEALPKFNWGASALDANAIKLLNEVPRLISAAAERTVVNEEQSPFTTNTVVALPADLLVALNPQQQALVQRFADRVVRATRAQSIQRILTLEKQCTELNDQLARMLTRTLPPPRPGVRG